MFVYCWDISLIIQGLFFGQIWNKLSKEGRIRTLIFISFYK